MTSSCYHSLKKNHINAKRSIKGMFYQLSGSFGFWHIFRSNCYWQYWSREILNMEYPMGHDWSIYITETVTGWNFTLNITQHTIMLGYQNAAAMIDKSIKTWLLISWYMFVNIVKYSGLWQFCSRVFYFSFLSCLNEVSISNNIPDINVSFVNEISQVWGTFWMLVCKISFTLKGYLFM